MKEKEFRWVACLCYVNRSAPAPEETPAGSRQSTPPLIWDAPKNKYGDIWEK